jgi:hypothetical protein
MAHDQMPPQSGARSAKLVKHLPACRPGLSEQVVLLHSGLNTTWYLPLPLASRPRHRSNPLSCALAAHDSDFVDERSSPYSRNCQTAAAPGKPWRTPWLLARWRIEDVNLCRAARATSPPSSLLISLTSLSRLCRAAARACGCSALSSANGRMALVNQRLRRKWRARGRPSRNAMNPVSKRPSRVSMHRCRPALATARACAPRSGWLRWRVGQAMAGATMSKR